MRWKKEIPQSPRPTEPLSYPSDIFVETETNIYFVRGGTKFKVFSDRVWKSWNTPAVRGSEIALSKYILGGSLGFRNGTLINNYADGKIYLISGNKRRLLSSPDVYEKYGLAKNWIEVSQSEVNLHDEGEPLE